MINLGMELSSLKLHHTSRLLVAVLVAALVACSAGSLSNSTDQTPEEPGETNGTSQDRLSGIPVNGNLVFSKRVQLSFAVSGEVGEILVREGDRVVAGQTLARLDSETVAALEANLSQTRFGFDQAEEALDIVREEFRTTPLELSKFLNYGAEARGRLDDAERELEDFERDYVEDLTRAQTAKADVGVRLDRAREDLEDFLSDYDQDLTDALQAKARADTQLDNAREALEDFHLDEKRDVVGAWNIVANRFEVLVLAEDRLTEFLFAPVGISAGDDGDEDQGPRTISGGEEDFGEGPYSLEEFRPAEGIANLRRLTAHVDLAKVKSWS